MNCVTTTAKQNEEEGLCPQETADTRINTGNRLGRESVINNNSTESDSVKIVRRIV